MVAGTLPAVTSFMPETAVPVVVALVHTEVDQRPGWPQWAPQELWGMAGGTLGLPTATVEVGAVGLLLQDQIVLVPMVETVGLAMTYLRSLADHRCTRLAAEVALERQEPTEQADRRLAATAAVAVQQPTPHLEAEAGTTTMVLVVLAVAGLFT